MCLGLSEMESLVARWIGVVQSTSGACSMLCGCATNMAGRMCAMLSDGGSIGAPAILCHRYHESARGWHICTLFWSKKSLTGVNDW